MSYLSCSLYLLCQILSSNVNAQTDNPVTTTTAPPPPGALQCNPGPTDDDNSAMPLYLSADESYTVTSHEDYDMSTEYMDITGFDYTCTNVICMDTSLSNDEYELVILVDPTLFDVTRGKSNARCSNDGDRVIISGITKDGILGNGDTICNNADGSPIFSDPVEAEAAVPRGNQDTCIEVQFINMDDGKMGTGFSFEVTVQMKTQ